MIPGPRVPGDLAQHRVAVGIVAALVFAFTWLFRFNDPNGAFAGLTDDHFFYVARGWQILFGDLPARDFVDNGAPLHYYVAAAVQLLFGRGTLSELTFSVTMIAVGAALTFWLATRASGSIALGLFAAFVQIWLTPRFYNYPKILVYTAAVPLLWWFVDRPGAWPRFWLAVVTAVGFLFRHDHGIFVAAVVAALFVLVPGLTRSERLRHAVVYVAVTVALLTPYFLFVQLNGGVLSYFEGVSSWALRERQRTEIVWPGLFDHPNGVSSGAQEAPTFLRPLWIVRDNDTAWWYYLELALPLLALGVLTLSRDAFRPAWSRAGPKVALVALLGIILNAGFLRSPLGARLADPSVPHVILIAWFGAALPAMLRLRESWRPAVRPWRLPLATGVFVVIAPGAFVVAATMSHNLYDRLDNAGLTEGLGRALSGASTTADAVRRDWDLARWQDRAQRPWAITLATYVNTCTPADARVFVQPYIPQVLALARRPFAGGHADLRTGFFATDDEQALTLDRLRRQHVPIALLGESPEEFAESFPIVGRYLLQEYDVAGQHAFGDGFDITLLLRTDAHYTRRFAELDWPCLT
jgi:hypothetical protein